MRAGYVNAKDPATIMGPRLARLRGATFTTIQIMERGDRGCGHAGLGTCLARPNQAIEGKGR